VEKGEGGGKKTLGGPSPWEERKGEKKGGSWPCFFLLRIRMKRGQKKRSVKDGRRKGKKRKKRGGKGQRRSLLILPPFFAARSVAGPEEKKRGTDSTPREKNKEEKKVSCITGRACCKMGGRKGRGKEYVQFLFYHPPSWMPKKGRREKGGLRRGELCLRFLLELRGGGGGERAQGCGNSPASEKKRRREKKRRKPASHHRGGEKKKPGAHKGGKKKKKKGGGTSRKKRGKPEQGRRGKGEGAISFTFVCRGTPRKKRLKEAR